MDYNSLIAQIQSYANRTDARFVNEIPNLINQAMNKIYYKVKDVGFEYKKVGNLAGLNPEQDIQFDVNWKETLSFIIRTDLVNPIAGGTQILLPRTYEFCLQYSPLGPNNTGLPLFYSMPRYGVFYLSPTPNLAYSYELSYLGLPLLDNLHLRNFLTDRYPALLLYGCMVEAQPFLKDFENIREFAALYTNALEDINRNSQARHIDRTYKMDKD